MSKQKLTVSFSGGRTSAYMARWLQVHKSDEYELQYVFANTGQEHEKTLEFVDRCDKEWGLGVVWVEAVVNPEKGKGTGHRVMNFETASRKGEPFEDVIAKYGIPNMAMFHCTRETKLRPINSYRAEVGLVGAPTAIGIRVDEIDRVHPKYLQHELIYPLVDWHPTTREQVVEWWANNHFDLELVEPYGNCVFCWKKSLRKLITIAKETPEAFDFPERMEKKYGAVGAMYENNQELQTFFRGRMSTQDIRERAQLPFEPFREGLIQQSLFPLDPLDTTNGCEESCEVY